MEKRLPDNALIRPYARIHATLIGMNNTGYRVNGGVGFAIAEPQIQIEACSSERLEILDRRNIPLSADGLKRLRETIRRFADTCNLSRLAQVTISGELPTHFGFGSSTAIRLATLEALLTLNGRNLNRDEMIASSGRGRTSGIGVNTYFDGGLILDIGHKQDSDRLLPSSQRENVDSTPLKIFQSTMPKWEIGICIPHSIVPKSESEEKEFFAKTCPITSEEVNRILYEVVYGVAAATIEEDLVTFCDSLRSIQDCAWKLAERSLYGEELRSLELDIYDSGALAVGMSSLGPSLFFLGHDLDNSIRFLATKHTDCTFHLTYPVNSGRRITCA